MAPRTGCADIRLISTATTLDQLPHVVIGLSEKLDRVLELLEKGRHRQPFQPTQAQTQNSVRERGLHYNRQVTFVTLPRH